MYCPICLELTVLFSSSNQSLLLDIESRDEDLALMFPVAMDKYYMVCDHYDRSYIYELSPSFFSLLTFSSMLLGDSGLGS